MNNITKIIGSVFVVLLLLFGGVYISNQRKEVSLGSVVNGNEYFSTSTDSVWNVSTTATTTKVLKSGYGALGSVTITGLSTGIINIYDGTTTTQGGNGNPLYATTTLAKFVPSVAAGTYVFDATFTKGLLVETPTGVIPVSTITWR